MRIIGGIHKGRKLKPVKGLKIRPTTDKVRESIFNVLADRLEDSVVLDLFAGSGAMGIEALSRGAAHVTFVDRDFDAINLIKSNLELVNEVENSRVLKGDVFRVCRRLGGQAQGYRIIFADPPYRAAFHNELVGLILANGLLVPMGVMVYETGSQFEFSENLDCFKEIKIKTYGDTKTWFLFL